MMMNVNVSCEIDHRPWWGDQIFDYLPIVLCLYYAYIGHRDRSAVTDIQGRRNQNAKYGTQRIKIIKDIIVSNYWKSITY